MTNQGEWSVMTSQGEWSVMTSQGEWSVMTSQEEWSVMTSQKLLIRIQIRNSISQPIISRIVIGTSRLTKR
jgi:hypothetical protein